MLSNWLLESIANEREEAKVIVNQFILAKELQNRDIEIDFSKIKKVVEILELSLFDLISPLKDKEKVKEISNELFKLSQILPTPENSIEKLQTKLKYSCFAILGDLGVSASKYLKEHDWDKSLLTSDNWKDKTFATIIDWMHAVFTIGKWDPEWTTIGMVLGVLGFKIAQKPFEEKTKEKQK